jgi:hypothetical protein
VLLTAKLQQRLGQLLGIVDDHDTPGPRLLDDASRLWRRVQRLAAMGLADISKDRDAIELACHALQLPMRQTKSLPAGRLGRTSLPDRAEQAAELLVTLLGQEIDERLLDRATRILHELPQRSPMLDEARLLADAVNLQDFGAAGFVSLSIQLARQGGGVDQVATACEKREQYGYWEARLRDGFHYPAVRQIAQRRLARWRQIADLLRDELSEDQA